jgi:hypothetical protein
VCTPSAADSLAQADITVSALPMDNSRASDFGLMKVRAAAPAALAGILTRHAPPD